MFKYSAKMKDNLDICISTKKLLKDQINCHKAREASERHISKKEGVEVIILEMI